MTYLLDFRDHRTRISCDLPDLRQYNPATLKVFLMDTRYNEYR